MSRYIHFIADELRALGHGVDLAFHNDIPCRADGRLRRLLVPGAVVQLVRQRLRQGHAYDVVEVHEPIAAAYALARRLDRTLPPLIACVYALEARGYVAQLAYWRTKGLPVSWTGCFFANLRVSLANLALRNADHVTVETQEDADYLRRHLHVPACGVSFLHGAANPRFFDTDGVDEQPRSGILFLATWIERKGILDLVAAVLRVLEKFPATPVTLAGVGLPAETVRACFPPPARDKIDVIPRINDDREMARLFHRHLLFLLPSVFEGQPLALLEAAAAGLAIVASNTCGMKDFIQHGHNGVLVEPGDPEALAVATLKLIEDPALALRLGAAARARAQTFSWRRSAEQFLAAAAAAIHRGRRKSFLPTRRGKDNITP